MQNLRKKQKKTILFLILLLCFSCKDNTEKSSVKSNSKSTKPIEKKNPQITNTIDSDSLELNEVLIGVLKIAKDNIHKNYFKKEYYKLSEKRSYQVIVKMEFGALFSKKYRLYLPINFSNASRCSVNAILPDCVTRYEVLGFLPTNSFFPYATVEVL